MIDTDTERGRKTRISSAGIAGADNALLQEIYVPPAQFFTLREYEQPEKRLMLAVLEEAIRCFKKGENTKSRRVRRLAEEAREWFFSGEEKHIFSFLVICNTLGFDAVHIQKQIKDPSWHYKRPSEVAESGRGFIVSFTSAQQLSRKLGREKELKAILRITPTKVAEALYVLQKENKWQEVYNLVFGFIFFYLMAPPQSLASVARHLKCTQTYAHKKLREKIFMAINEREPLFLEALYAIAKKCGMDMRALGTLLSRLR